MQQLEFLKTPPFNGQFHISSQLADAQLPLFLYPEDDITQRKILITAYTAFHTMITTIGEIEHSGDWDPCITVTLNDGTIIGNDDGYDMAQISGDNLLIEHPNDDGESPTADEDCHYTVAIKDIQSLLFTY